MNKRILVIAIALVLMLTLMIPVQLQAKSGNVPQPPSRSQQFSADGFVYILDPGTITKSIQFGPLVYQHQIGEEVNGFITNSNWSELNGASIIIKHSADTIANLKMGTFIATASGTITLVLADNSILSGSYQALIYGNFDAYGNYTIVNDIAQWDLGKKAQGNASATLYPYSGTLGGAISMSGTHK
jgi:hypothetical protein